MPRPLEDATGFMIQGPLSFAKQSEVEAWRTRRDSKRKQNVFSLEWTSHKERCTWTNKIMWDASYCRIPGTRREAQRSEEQCGSFWSRESAASAGCSYTDGLCASIHTTCEWAGPSGFESFDTDRTPNARTCNCDGSPRAPRFISGFREAAAQTKCALQWKPTNTSPELTGFEWLSHCWYL